MTLLDRLIAALRRQPEWVQPDGTLNKWLVIGKAQEGDARLVELLWQDEVLRRHFFRQAGPAVVFRGEQLAQLLEQHAFLPHSYTRFRNRIGLSANGTPLKLQGAVVLEWPYKDCVLEGGQSRAEQQREEVFFNEVLARDEITQLLEPKVLTRAQRHDAAGSRPLDTFRRDADLNRRRGLPARTITDNLFIRGNNLMALASLLPRFSGRIKLIYIDPPYNTGNDTFRYNDRFKRSTWLTFMKNRLELARRLLHDEGAIFVQCDDREQAYLKVLMDELFGEANYRETIVVKTSTPSGVNAINVRRGERLFKLKEYLLFYSKTPAFRFHPILVRAPYNPNYRYEVRREGGRWVVEDLRARFPEPEALARYALAHYEHIYSLERNNKKAGERMKAALAESRTRDEVVEFTNSKGEVVLLYRGGVFIPLRKRIVREGDEVAFGTLISDLWDDEIFQSNRHEGGVSLPGGKKPEKLLRRILELTTRPGDIVLDYHLGSGTTAAVAHKMGRQYIGIEQLDYGDNDPIVRLRHVIEGDPTGISKAVGWQGGGGFVSLELKKHNQLFLDRIAAAKNAAELLAVWNDMKAHSLLHYSLELQRFEAARDEFTALPLHEQKQLLADMLDRNHLYVPLSALDDRDFAVSDEDRKITKDFYGATVWEGENE